MAALTSSFQGVRVHSAVQSSFKGNQNGLKINRGNAVVVMRKKELHPDWYDSAVVTCNGEEVLVTSGTKPAYNVDIWSGNHPLYQGVTSTVVTDEGSVNRFKRRYAGLDSLSTITTMASLSGKPSGPLKLETPPAPSKPTKGKGKKK